MIRTKVNLMMVCSLRNELAKKLKDGIVAKRGTEYFVELKVVDNDLLPLLSSFIRRVCSGYGPPGTGL